MNRLLYLSYGTDRRYHLELTYSIHSAMQFLKSDPADIQIILLSDEQNVRHDLPVQKIIVDHQTIRDWQMGGSYNHAMQAYALHHVLELHAAPTILIDTDTYFKRHPSELFLKIGPGRSLLNRREGQLSQLREWPEYRLCIERLGGKINDIEVAENTEMYNGGVVGIHPADTDLLKKIKEAMFAVRQVSSVFTAVQLAASMVLTSETALSTCEEVVEHYWGGPRYYYHYQINRLYPEVMRREPITCSRDPLPPLRGIPDGPVLTRLFVKLRFLFRGKSPEYRFAFLAYACAISLRRSDPEMASVWAIAAVDALTWAAPERPEEGMSDFRLFSPPRIGAQTWLDPHARRKWLAYWLVDSEK